MEWLECSHLIVCIQSWAYMVERSTAYLVGLSWRRLLLKSYWNYWSVNHSWHISMRRVKNRCRVVELTVVVVTDNDTGTQVSSLVNICRGFSSGYLSRLFLMAERRFHKVESARSPIAWPPSINRWTVLVREWFRERLLNSLVTPKRVLARAESSLPLNNSLI